MSVTQRIGFAKCKLNFHAIGVFLQRCSFLEKGQWEGQWCLKEFLVWVVSLPREWELWLCIWEVRLNLFPCTLKCDYNNTNDHPSIMKTIIP